MWRTVKLIVYRCHQAALRRWRTLGLTRALRNISARAVVKHFNLDGIQFDMMLLSHDVGLSYHLLVYDWREYYSTRYFIHDFMRKGEVIIDIGANLGYFALIEASACPQNKVYALEPTPESFKTLQINVQINNLTNVQTFNTAIGDKDGFVNFFVCNALNLSGILPDAGRVNGIGGEWIKAPITTLHDFSKRNMKEKPTMLRMDVEGYEYNILTGNRSFLEEHKPRLFFEFHLSLLGKSRVLNILNVLREIGYDDTTVIRGDLFVGLSSRLFDPPDVGERMRRGGTEDLIDEIAKIRESKLKYWSPWAPHMFMKCSNDDANLLQK